MAEVSRDQEERLRRAVYSQEDPGGKLLEVLAEILPIVMADANGVRAVGHAVRAHLEIMAESELMSRRGQILFDGDFSVSEGVTLGDLQKQRSDLEFSGLKMIKLNYCQLFPKRPEDGVKVLLRDGDHALVNLVYLVSPVASRPSSLVKAVMNRDEGWVVVIDGDRANVGFIYMREIGAELPACYADRRVVPAFEDGRFAYRCGDEVVRPIMEQPYGGSGESYAESFDAWGGEKKGLKGISTE
jgi:hypothetical protein